MCENFTKEQSFFISVLRFSLTGRSFNDQSYNLTPSEYDFVVNQAEKHRVIPLIASAFNSKSFEYIPGDIINRVNELDRDEVVRNI